MITVRETALGFERIGGNPVLLSLDGKRKARLRVILHPSWTDRERAEFGIFQAEPATIPDGKEQDGAPTFERQNGKVMQVIPMRDKPLPEEPKPTPLDDLRTDLEALAQRVTALEGVRQA